MSLFFCNCNKGQFYIKSSLKFIGYLGSSGVAYLYALSAQPRCGILATSSPPEQVGDVPNGQARGCGGLTPRLCRKGTELGSWLREDAEEAAGLLCAPVSAQEVKGGSTEPNQVVLGRDRQAKASWPQGPASFLPCGQSFLSFPTAVSPPPCCAQRLRPKSLF